MSTCWKKLAEILRIGKVQSLAGFFGQDLWQGDLSEMREDRSHGQLRKKKNRR